MEFDVEELLAPIEGDDPAGPDLAYDPGRYALEQVFESSVSVDASGEAAAVADVDWRGIIRDTVSQFGRTKDVWLAVYLCRAGARGGVLEAVEAGSAALQGLFERYWAEVHPKIEELGIPGRKTPCDSLASRAEFLGPLERVPLIRHGRLGTFSGADLEKFRLNGASEERYGFFRAALEELGEDAVKAAHDQLDRVETSLRGADRLFMDNAAGEGSPNFSATYETLAMLKRATKSFLSDASGDAAGPVGEAGSADGGPAVSGGGADAGGRLAGRIESRDDVIRALELICDYYRRKEPASPVPLALARAQSWVAADFMDIIRDIAPESVTEASRVLVRRPVEE